MARPGLQGHAPALVFSIPPRFACAITAGFIPIRFLPGLSNADRVRRWFFGFKLHLFTSDAGHVVDFMLTPGNTDDRCPLAMKGFIDKLFGKLYGDKGYISKELFEGLFHQGIHLVTKLRKNMKTKMVTPLADAILLHKRAICETIISSAPPNSIEGLPGKASKREFMN